MPKRIGIAIALFLGLVAWLLFHAPVRQPRAAAAPGAVLEASEVPQHAEEPNTPAEAEARTEQEEPLPDPSLAAPTGLPASLVVRVLDSRGDPARGAAVRLHRNRRGRVMTGPPFAAGATDAEGKARFEGSSGDNMGILAHSDREVGYGQVGLNAGANEATIRMEPALPVMGTVLDRNGTPVCGAEVMLSLSGPVRGAETEVSWALTDLEGHVPIPNRELAARPYYQVVASGFRTAYGELEKQSLLRAGFEIRLEPLATVTGRVVDRDGKGVADVIVEVRETWEQVSSERDGRFELQGLLQGGGTLVIEPRKHGRVILRNVRPGALEDIVLGPGLSISGIVVRPDGSPVGGAFVRTVCETSNLSTGSTNADSKGRFVVGGLSEGPYTVSTADPKGRVASRAKVLGIAAGTEDLRLVLRSHPELRIELVNAETEEEAWVLRLETRATLRGTAQTVSEVIESPRKRRVNGTTLILDAAGEYDVSVLTPGCPEQVVSVTLGPEEKKTVEVRLPRVE